MKIDVFLSKLSICLSKLLYIFLGSQNFVQDIESLLKLLQIFKRCCELLRHLGFVTVLDDGGVLQQEGDGFQVDAGVHVLLHAGHPGHAAQQISRRQAEFRGNIVRGVYHCKEEL